MPVVKIENINDDLCWGLWKIGETSESLLNFSYLSEAEKKELFQISNIKRKKEWLAARALLRHMVEKHLMLEYQGTFKDDHKKPFLFGQNLHISIAHSFPYAVVLINKSHPCGIDIEKPKPALFHVAPKFLDAIELKEIKNNPEDLCLAWAAKEVLFKLHGKQKLNFKDNLHIQPYSLKNKRGQIKADIKLSESNVPYSLVYEIRETYVICYSL